MSHFYEVFKECEKFVFSNQFQQAIRGRFNRHPLDSFRTVEELLAFLNKRSIHTCLGEVRRQNEIFKSLLKTYKESNWEADFKPLFLVIFKPALLSLFNRYRTADAEADEIGQVIFAGFLEVINNYSLSKRPNMIATNIILDTKQRVSLWILQQNRRHQMEVQAFEELPEAENVYNPKHENILICLLDLANGFGYDESTDRICIRINQLHKRGIVNDTEKEILLGRLVYQKSLREMVPDEEYERWKKQIQRLTRKIMSKLST